MRIISAFLFTALLTMNAWAQFTKGNLVVVQMGDGSAALTSSSTPVFVKEYTPTGSLVQTITIPSTGSSPRFTVTGNSGSEGHLIRSTDGSYLTIAGYDTVAGATSFALAATKRVVARIDASGTVDLTTELTDGSTAAVRSVVMDNNSNTWTATSAVGIRYKAFGSTGTSTQLSTTPTNTRVVKIFNGQLYITSASGAFLGVSSIGSGTPTTSGQTTTALPGMPTSGTHSPYSFSMSPDGNTLYIADDGSVANGGGIQKWTLSGGTWSKAYTLLNTGTTNIPARGLTADFSGTHPVIYATTGTSAPNALIEVVDSSSTAIVDTLAVSPTNTVFRGVDFAPTNGPAFIAVTGGPLSFGNVAVGTPSTEQTYTVRGGNLTNNITITAPAQFEISTTSGSGFGPSVTLTQANGVVNTTTIYVRFHPTALGAASGNITLASTGVTTQNVSVSGNGIQAGFSVSRSTISFGNLVINNQSKKDSVYVKNTGTNSLNIDTVTSDNSLFTVSPSSASLNAGDSGWFYITFTPTSLGAKSANIVFTDNAPSSPDTVKVTGTGVNAPPPSIGAITRSTRVPNTGDSVVVSAKVTDMFGLTGVRLIYYVNDVADSVTMTTPDSVYSGKIPGSVNQNGKRVEYRIHAISTSGMDTLTAKIGYFAGISPISLSGLKGEDANLLNLYKGYYVKVTGVINGPNYQAANLSQYIQDTVGGLNLFKTGAVANAFNLGDSLVVLGKLDQYRGTTELTPDTVAKDIQMIASGKKVTPITLTIAQFNANPELYESRLIRFSGVYKRYSTQSWGSNTSLVMYEGTQNDTVIMYINSGVDAASASEPGYPVRITAIAVQFTGSGTATTGPYEIQPRYQTDFETVPATPTIVTPIDKATGVPRRTTFNWNRAANATMYHLQVSTNNTFSTTVFDTILADTATKLNTPLAVLRTYYWHVSAIDTVDSSNYSAFVSFKTGTGIDAVIGSEGTPKEFALYQNYPNPFNPSTMIGYDLPKNSFVKVTIYDILGREVATLVNGVQQASHQMVKWEPSGLSSGIYFFRIQAQSQDGTNNFTSVKKLLYMK